MELTKLLLIACITTIIPGQLIRIPLPSTSAAVTITDILVFSTAIFFIFHSLLITRHLKLPPKIFFPCTLFVLSAASSTILSSFNFSQEQILISSMFLIRFALYFFLTIIIINCIKKPQVQRFVDLYLIVGFIFTLLGTIQLVVFPDFSSLIAYGWDPHQKRIASTFLDPNFSGWVFSTIIAFSITSYTLFKKKVYLVLSTFVFFALILTFSRSSYLSVLVMALTISLLKSPKVVLAALVFFMIAFLSISQARSRIIGAFTFDATAQARFESWQNALIIFRDHPLFGIGFNTYRFAQAKYGFFSIDNPLGGHSGAGSDSSILLVAATTGIFGLTFFIFMLLAIFQSLKKHASSNLIHLASLSSFLGLIVHSQFVNSFFFPQIMLIVWFFVGLSLVNENT